MTEMMREGGFLWGAATSAYQIEGATREDRRGEYIWDRFAVTPGKVANGDTGEVACDHYHRVGEDVALMAELGLGAYRFSVAWPRILPNGTGRVNQVGLDFYDRLVDALLAASIRPFVTLYHWDLPQTLQDRWGGWTNRDTAEAFADYADAVSRRLGDRVSDWITLNEPWCSAWLGHALGVHAPGAMDLRKTFAAAHHLMLAHGHAVPVLRANSRAARVGLTLNLTPVYPLTDADADHEAAQRADGAMNRWFLDAAFKGRYPDDVLREFDGYLPELQPGDLAAMCQPLDFLGVNYYTRTFVRARVGALGLEEARIEGVERTAMGWEVYPEGLYDILTRVHREYDVAELYVTESGAAYDDAVTASGEVHDERRRAYLEEHFAAARRAIAAGVPLRGYFVWSLLDNFEWAEGYRPRFGLVYVDYATQRRIVKDSGRWFARVIQGEE